jgi:hypothetical protein
VVAFQFASQEMNLFSQFAHLHTYQLLFPGCVTEGPCCPQQAYNNERREKYEYGQQHTQTDDFRDIIYLTDSYNIVYHLFSLSLVSFGLTFFEASQASTSARSNFIFFELIRIYGGQSPLAMYL